MGIAAAPAHLKLAAAPAKFVIDRVSKEFATKRGDVHALDNVSLEVGEGEFVCLLGPSGCGKSTLLDIMAGLTRPDRGRILADGERVTGPGRKRMVMFQESALFPWLDVLGNVMFGLKLTPGLSHAERLERAQRFLRMVGLEAFSRANVHELSGGMKQRVALARALAPDPEVLLMDEPFAALDAITRDQLYVDIQRVWQETGKTIIFVTHNVREAICLGDRVILMSARPGRIRREFQIPLPRPRDINGVDLARHSTEVARALRDVVDAAQ
jgi:NitT/TauT family transport system ATP-binding protein